MYRRLITVTTIAAVLGVIATPPAAFAKKGSLSQIDAMRKSDHAAEHANGGKRKAECKKQALEQGYTDKHVRSDFIKSCKTAD
jgi:hypothetical protein